MSEPRLIIYQRPELAKPYLVMGFEGWPDAGKVSSGVVAYLRDKLAAGRLAEVKADDFYLFQSPGAEVRRPVTDIQDGLVKALALPATTFWFYKAKKPARDLILVLGREPELRWGDYVSLILDLAQDFGVVRIYAIGGTYDVVPHTIEPLIGVVLSVPSLESEMREHEIQPINYRGPSSIHTTLLVSAGKRDIEVISLWGYVPHYVQVPNTKVCYSVLSKLVKMLEMPLNLDDIRRESEQLDGMVDKAVAQKPELQDYVRRLEVEYGQGRYEAGEPLKEDVIKEIEDFLRRGGEG
jgi:proteasome assembly chaperone (PAC2) family protein